jgi:hypothetical protein
MHDDDPTITAEMVRTKIREAEGRPGVTAYFARAWLCAGIREGTVDPAIVPPHLRPTAEVEDRRRFEERRRRESRRAAAILRGSRPG